MIFLGLSLVGSLHAQFQPVDGLPFLREHESEQLDKQALSFYQAIQPLAESLKHTSVGIEHRGRRLALGTVTSVGVVSKWSEVMRYRDTLTYRLPTGERVRTRPIGVIEEFDLVILSAPEELKSLDISSSKGMGDAQIGEFLFVAGPGGEAHSLGVVSVAPRSLRESDKAYLGVVMDMQYAGEGVRIRGVQEGTTAAKADLRANDIVLEINGEPLKGALEMGNILQQMKAGSEVTIRYQRLQQEQEINLTLGGRPQFQDQAQGRIQKMQKMGATLSKVRSDFPNAMQSDMPLDPEDCGGPVYNLEGEFLGIAIARASRTKSYIIPADELAELLSPKETTASIAEEVEPDAANELNEEEGLPIAKAEIEPERAQLVDPEGLVSPEKLHKLIEQKRKELMLLEQELIEQQGRLNR